MKIHTKGNLVMKKIDWETDKTPICYNTGDWDGKASDLCLCQDDKGKYHLAKCYEYHNGEFEWYDTT